MDIVTAALSIILVFILFLMTRPDAEKLRIKQLLNKMPGPPNYPIFGTAWELMTSPVHRKYTVSVMVFCNGMGLWHSGISTHIHAPDNDPELNVKVKEAAVSENKRVRKFGINEVELFIG
jgi:hypothetical protein